jgi:hypothetical protein
MRHRRRQPSVGIREKAPHAQTLRAKTHIRDRALNLFECSLCEKMSFPAQWMFFSRQSPTKAGTANKPTEVGTTNDFRRVR